MSSTRRPRARRASRSGARPAATGAPRSAPPPGSSRARSAPSRPPGGGTGARFLTRVRRACLALPDAEERVAWGSPTFRVRGRLFVMFHHDHHGDGRLALWCNAPEGAQEALVASDPDNYFIPPYVGSNGWIGVRLDRSLPWSAVAARIEVAHRVTADRGRARRR